MSRPLFIEPSGENPVPFAAWLDAVPEFILFDLADALEVPVPAESRTTSPGPSGRSPARDLERDVERAMRDVERTRARLLALPGYALVVLGALTEARGQIRRKQLDGVVAERTGRPEALEGAIQLLSSTGFLLRGMGDRDEVLSLVQPEAGTVARLVTGIGHPTEPPPHPPEDPGSNEREREILAIATLTLHRKIRWTAAGAPHRVTLKAFTKNLGPDDSRIEERVFEAVKGGLLRPLQDGTQLLVGALLTAASIGVPFPRGSLLAEVSAAIPVGGWVPAVALGPRVAAFGGPGAVVPASAVVAGCRGYFAVGEHAGHTWIGKAAGRRSQGSPAGDGHVTPNLEVMLGPEANLDIVAGVGMFAELCRIDRVLTFRITPASVAAGLGAGQSVATFLATLDRVGRHAVPDNVRITVNDFAVRVATVRRVLSVAVPTAATEGVVRELGRAVVDSPRAGLILVDADTAMPALEKALGRAGLKMTAAAPPASGPDDEPAPAPRALPAVPQADGELRSVVLRETTARFEPSLRAFERARPVMHIDPDRPAAATARAARDDLRSRGGPPLTVRALDRLAVLVDGVQAELDAWVKRLPRAAAPEARDALLSPIALIPFASLLESERRRVLTSARSFGELLAGAEAAARAGRVTLDGGRVLGAFYRLDPHAGPRRATARLPSMAGTRGEPGVRRIRRGPMLEVELQAFIEMEDLVTVAVRPAGGRLAVHTVIPSSLHNRGAERVLLATDAGSEEGMAFPLSTIEWVEVDADLDDDATDEDDDYADDEADDAFGVWPEDPAREKATLQALARRLTALARPRPSVAAEGARIGRNDPCPCGSGKKYKKCHGASA